MFLQCIQNVIKVLRTCFAPNIVKTLRRRCLNVAQTILRSCAGNIDKTKCSIGGVVGWHVEHHIRSNTRRQDSVTLFAGLLVVEIIQEVIQSYLNDLGPKPTKEVSKMSWQ
jgi:hypothetical protein